MKKICEAARLIQRLERTKRIRHQVELSANFFAKHNFRLDQHEEGRKTMLAMVGSWFGILITTDPEKKDSTAGIMDELEKAWKQDKTFAGFLKAILAAMDDNNALNRIRLGRAGLFLACKYRYPHMSWQKAFVRITSPSGPPRHRRKQSRAAQGK